jgi:hypothetical protein
LQVSENEWRRHNKEMEPQGRGSVSPLYTRRRNRTLDLRKTTLKESEHVKNNWAECRKKQFRHRADGDVFLLTFLFIGLPYCRPSGSSLASWLESARTMARFYGTRGTAHRNFLFLKPTRTATPRGSSILEPGYRPANDKALISLDEINLAAIRTDHKIIMGAAV